ncbi:hypothetical protein I309_06229 [Cryptococcus deuterogattii LA55]|nr:hypothetical protein I309_06229 [Cryptococcus deuterogattii LA55]KIR94472.1 hypothetical protein I304_02114 [Cryptococcus deuterogattii CBS 10090]
MAGLHHASVTKAMMMLLGVTTLAASLLDIKPYLHLQFVPHMTKYHQYWRILSHPFAFANSAELLMGEVLLYGAGVYTERAFGSRKYASFILISSVISTILACAVIVLLHPFGIKSIPGGPYGVIFSILWQRYRMVPPLYQFNLFGIHISQKFFQWIFALQLMLSVPPSSILISLCGLLSGYIYRTDIMFPIPSFSPRSRRFFVRQPLKTYRIPLSIYNLFGRIFGPFIGVSAPPRRSDRVLPGQINERRGIMAGLPAGVAAVGGAGAGAEGTPRPSLRSLLAGRIAAESRTQTPGPNAINGGEEGDDEREGEPGSTRAAMGEWVSGMTGRSGARAPTEDEIRTLSAMFPNLSRETIVRALQRNDYNTAQAVEALLQQNE